MASPMHPMRARVLLVAVAAIAAAAGFAGHPREMRPEPDHRRIASAERPVLGFGINAHHISDLPAYLDAVDSIAAIGANSLVLVTPMFQQYVDSSEVRRLDNRCPTDDQLLAILGRARSHGLRTMLLPIVLIEEPGEKDWRGVIAPTDREAWWASYDRFVDHYLDLAIRARVDVLSVGSELNSFEHESGRWAAIIERVRSRFEGLVTYTANWDRYHAVPFWNEVDFMGVSSYFELSRDDPEAPVRDLARSWRTERNRMVSFADRVGRDFVLMELGYPSLPWAAAHPWNYVAEEGVEADHEAQARCWTAFFEAWTDLILRPDGPFVGFSCYYWDPYHSGEPIDTGYGVDGKPAHEVIRLGFARIRAETGSKR